MDLMTRQTIDMYSKLLRLPTFRKYEDVIRRLDKDAGYADFLAELMKQGIRCPAGKCPTAKHKSSKVPLSQDL